MSDVSGLHAVDVDAPRAACTSVLDDVAGYPAWYDTIDAATVVARDDAGRPTRAQLAIAAGPLGKIELTLDLTREPGRLAGAQIAGNGRVERVRMEWTLDPLGESRTRVAYRFSADAATWRVRAALRAARPLVERDLVRRPPEALRRRVESGAAIV